MKVLVYDTYVKKSNGIIMHFDILVEENKTIDEAIAFGKIYLKAKHLDHCELTAKECTFCHMEIAPKQIEEAISKNGYYIIQMENC